MKKPVVVSTGINTDSYLTGYKNSIDNNRRYVKHLKIDDGQISSFYNIGNVIGQGNFGTVYEVRDVKDRKIWAMKIIVKVSLSHNIMRQLDREMQILKILNHPHIIGLREVFESSKKIYLVLERCMQDLGHLLKQTKRFNEIDTKRVTIDLANAVSYLHKNDIVHRDIKLENILLTRNPDDVNDTMFIKLTDFGLSIIKTGHGYTDMLHDRCGTLSYMAPEILISQSYSQQCDIWAVGIIMYVLVSGHWPFEGHTDKDVIDKICYTEPHFETIDVSLECKDLMMKLLNKNPAARITASEMLCHPWMLGKKLDVCSTSHNILDMMRMWNNKDLRVPVSEEDVNGVCYYRPDRGQTSKTASVAANRESASGRTADASTASKQSSYYKQKSSSKVAKSQQSSAAGNSSHAGRRQT